MLAVMGSQIDTRMRARCAVLAGAPALALLLVLALGLAIAPGALAASTVSSNWGGYVALPGGGAQQGFRSVSGSWRVPRVSCSAGQDTYSAAWVGLGGYRQGSSALEQIGTDADCSRSGHTHYATWFELIPAAPVRIGLRIHAGDVLTASVTVRSHDVTFRLRNLTTRARYATTRHVRTVDTSSADWILEAPSSCDASGCHTLALADFGTMSFLGATAIRGSHTGPVEDPRWSAVAVEMRQGSRKGLARNANGHALISDLITASPSEAEGELGAFSMTWGEEQLQGEAPSPPTLGEPS